MSDHADDLLKALLQAEMKGSDLHGSELAQQLGMSPSGVTRLASRLKEAGLLDHRPYKPLLLTAVGREKAAGLIRKHRLWELFLQKSLNMGWNEVHREAEQLEHQTSEEMANRLDDYLGHPAFDPHGEPIPDRYGRIAPNPGICLLADAEPGRTYQVAGVTDRSDALMDYFTDIGLELNSKVRIIGTVELDGSLILSLGSHRSILSPAIARNIYVKEI